MVRMMTVVLWAMVVLFALAVFSRAVIVLVMMVISAGGLVGRGAVALAHAIRAALGPH